MAADGVEVGALAGVVLTGGRSRRMGRDKATLPVPGTNTTLAEQVVDIVGRRCQPVFVMAAPGQPLPTLPARILRDELLGLGPLLATGHGLRAAAAAGARYAFVCAVDMPFLTVELIDDLVRLTAATNAEVVLPWDGHSHYLAAVYRTDLADRVDALVDAGEHAMRALIETSDTQQIVLSNSRVLTNVNSEADLRLVAQLGGTVARG